MTDLADEVRASFEGAHEATTGDNHNPVQIVSLKDGEMAPAFDTAREYFGGRLLVACRRGYRQFAGSVMPDSGDALLELTQPKMLPQMIALALLAFSDGVMIGHRDHMLVRIAFHQERPDHLYEMDQFRDASTTMAAGFSDDQDVLQYLREYVEGAVQHMAHVCGFAHETVEPKKIWDIWMLSGSAMITASYLAGQRMGNTWRERDVLDGIALASEHPVEDEIRRRLEEGSDG